MSSFDSIDEEMIVLDTVREHRQIDEQGERSIRFEWEDVYIAADRIIDRGVENSVPSAEFKRAAELLRLLLKRWAYRNQQEVNGRETESQRENLIDAPRPGETGALF